MRFWLLHHISYDAAVLCLLPWWLHLTLPPHPWRVDKPHETETCVACCCCCCCKAPISPSHQQVNQWGHHTSPSLWLWECECTLLTSFKRSLSLIVFATSTSPWKVVSWASSKSLLTTFHFREYFVMAMCDCLQASSINISITTYNLYKASQRASHVLTIQDCAPFGIGTSTTGLPFCLNQVLPYKSFWLFSWSWSSSRACYCSNLKIDGGGDIDIVVKDEDEEDTNTSTRQVGRKHGRGEIGDVKI